MTRIPPGSVPLPLGEGWRLHKQICGRARQAVCELWSHQLGWELRLVIDGGELTRSQVCRSNDEILDTQERRGACGPFGGHERRRIRQRGIIADRTVWKEFQKDPVCERQAHTRRCSTLTS